MAILDIKNMYHSYEEGVYALSDVSVMLKKGERVAVLGNNGSGKSTFFLCCNGVLKAESGQILLNGKQISYKRKELLLLRRAVGLVFQDADDQIIASTVEEEISFGPMNLGLHKAAVQERVTQSIEYMGLESLRKRPPHELSGGEKKRVSIADILAMESEIILFDEPTASLDAQNTRVLVQILHRLHEQEKTLVVSTHDIDFAWNWADRVIVFHAGKILRDGSPEQVFSDEKVLQTAGLRRPILCEVTRMLKQQGILRTPFSAPKELSELEGLLSKEKEMDKRGVQAMQGILVVSFGTGYKGAQSSIEAVEKTIEEHFGNHKIRRAFTSGMIIKKLASRGIHVDTVSEALQHFLQEGIGDIVVQPTHLMAGIEYEKLVADVQKWQGEFESIKIGSPLLATDEDKAQLANILAHNIEKPSDACLVLMGHGSAHRENRVYGDMQAQFEKQGHHDVFVGTVEGVPNGEDVLKRAQGYQNVVMAPLMLVAGDHAMNDMAGEEDSWKSMFEANGMNVCTILKGLGEYQGVLDMYVEHVKQAMQP